MPISKPEWFKIFLPQAETYARVATNLKRQHLNTICQSARCPNRSACWSAGTATFLILGPRCTRSCGFCAVEKGKPYPPDEAEPERVAQAVVSLGLRYAVITSVTRDDLADGGAGHFAATIKAIRRFSPSCSVEVLIPDFQGSEKALELILASHPDIINHNLEVPAALYPLINREKANYFRSLELIKKAKKRGFMTKSGLMVGLGESQEDLYQTLFDLRSVGCDLLTIGQYLQPTRKQMPVAKFYSPEEFTALENKAYELGFLAVAAGPLVRSSYLAHELQQKVKECAT